MKNTTTKLTKVNTQNHSAPAGELFVFESRHSVRVFLGQQGEPVFITQDICDVFEMNHLKALERLPEWAKGLPLKRGLEKGGKGSVQYWTTLTEAGVYWLAMRSNKPVAERFQRWVCEEVLPAIRKHGFYQREGIDPRISHIERANMLRARRAAIIAEARAMNIQIATLEELGEDACTVREALAEAGEDMHLLSAITICLAFARRNNIPVGRRKGRMTMPRESIRAALNLNQGKLPLGENKKSAAQIDGGAR